MLPPNWWAALRGAAGDPVRLSKIRPAFYRRLEYILEASFYNRTKKNPAGNETTANRLIGWQTSSFRDDIDELQARIRGDRGHILCDEITDCLQEMYVGLIKAVERLRLMDDVTFARTDKDKYIRNAVNKANRFHRDNFAPGAVYALRPSSGRNAKLKKKNKKLKAAGLPELPELKPRFKEGQPRKATAENGWDTWIQDVIADGVGIPSKEYTSWERAERQPTELELDMEGILKDLEEIEGLPKQALKLWWEGVSIVDTAKVIGISEYRVRELRRLIKERVATVVERRRAV